MHRTAHLGCNSCYRFHLYKENKDTQEALRVIGKMLGLQVPVCHCFHQNICNFSFWVAECIHISSNYLYYPQPRSFRIAGTKDKRAITTQQVLIFHSNLCCQFMHISTFWISFIYLFGQYELWFNITSMVSKWKV